MIERHTITSREQWLALRKYDVTASAVGALLGVHEYQTGFGLWALKTGRIEEDPEETAPMQRGRLLEPVALQLLGEKRPTWRIEPPQVYLRDPEARLGATPDAFATDPERAGLGIVQIKTVEPSVFRKKWRSEETGEVEPPLWIAVQAITEAHLAGATWAAVVAMTVGFGLDLHVVEVPIHPGVVERIYAAVADFWALVADGRTPDPDYARDGSVIERLFSADAGEERDLRSDNFAMDLVVERERLSAEKSVAEKRLKEIKAELLTKLDGAATGRLADGRLVTAKRIDRAAYSVDATSYVDLRIKGKAA